MRMSRLGTAVLLAAAACGDNLEDPFVGLVRVSGGSPFSANCNGGMQGGVTHRGLEVEPSLAVDPAKPDHLIGAWQQDRWTTGGANGLGTATSSDGGKTWTASTAKLSRCEGGDYERATDPWVTITADGAAYQISVSFDNTGPRNGVLASRSSDGGLTWDDPVVLQADTDPDVFNDKDSITADPTDPHLVYAVWDRLTGLTQPTKPIGTGPTMLARAVDGTWEPARPIFDPGLDAQTIGNVIVVLPDGTLVDGFDLITHNSSMTPETRATVVRSTDHGATWSSPIDVAALAPLGVTDTKHAIPLRTGSILPQIAADPKSPRIYMVWEDGNGGSHEQIVLASSADGGMTWSAPVPINQVADVDAFDPVVAVDADGVIAVTYYDLRDDDPQDKTTFRITAWLVTSRDHGATWTEEALTAPFDLAPDDLGGEYFLGDYQGLAASADTFVPFFAAANSDDDPTDIFVRPVR